MKIVVNCIFFQALEVYGEGKFVLFSINVKFIHTIDDGKFGVSQGFNSAVSFYIH